MLSLVVGGSERSKQQLTSLTFNIALLLTTDKTGYNNNKKLLSFFLTLSGGAEKKFFFSLSLRAKLRKRFSFSARFPSFSPNQLCSEWSESSIERNRETSAQREREREKNWEKLCSFCGAGKINRGTLFTFARAEEKREWLLREFFRAERILTNNIAFRCCPFSSSFFPYADKESLRKGNKIVFLAAQRGARTHDPEIKSLMLYRLS